MSLFYQKCRVAVYCGNLSVKITKRLIYTHKMSEKPTVPMTNGFESKTPFLIGVAGGTASGKVSPVSLINYIDFFQWNVMQ